MWISNNAQFSDGNWESYKTTKNWTLSTGEGRKNVYLKVKYSDDTISDISSDDILPQPMQPSIVIANDSVYTSRRNVVLSLTALGENLTMKVSQDSNFIGVSWENFAASENITLSTGEGPKIVYAKFKNDFEIESKIITDDVILDMTAPTADFSVTPNYGIVNETNYSFDASGSHDAYPVLLRWDWENDGSFDTDWLTDKTTTYQYSVGGGNKTVKLEVKDGAGNTNSTSKQIYINTRPVASFTVTQDKNNYKLYYVDASSSSDFEDGTNLEYRWDWENDGTWDINYNTTKTASYQYTDDGDKTINLEVKDTKGLAHLTETDITTVRLIVTDIDGNVYKTVKIGDQWWMAENLKVTKYRNGDPIPNVTSNSEWANLTTGAYCNYDNNDSYVSTYGRLYNWYAVNDSRGLAPAGWHVPTDAEWKQLEMYLGMSQSEANETGYRGTDEGGKLKETGTGHWSSPNTGATNESGFSGLPGGYRFHDGTFNVVGSSAYFWSASSAYSGYYAWYRPLYCNRSDVYRSGNYVQDGFSVRCVRD
ncbi:hypothetical protein JW935_16775 [candidate division KSB1 bacterium]|nr:hypothetical protein [candidate division KSB1 bacterium]